MFCCCCDNYDSLNQKKTKKCSCRNGKKVCSFVLIAQFDKNILVIYYYKMSIGCTFLLQRIYMCPSLYPLLPDTKVNLIFEGLQCLNMKVYITTRDHIQRTGVMKYLETWTGLGQSCASSIPG